MSFRRQRFTIFFYYNVRYIIWIALDYTVGSYKCILYENGDANKRRRFGVKSVGRSVGRSAHESVRPGGGWVRSRRRRRLRRGLRDERTRRSGPRAHGIGGTGIIYAPAGRRATVGNALARAITRPRRRTRAHTYASAALNGRRRP